MESNLHAVRVAPCPRQERDYTTPYLWQRSARRISCWQAGLDTGELVRRRRSWVSQAAGDLGGASVRRCVLEGRDDDNGGDWMTGRQGPRVPDDERFG